MMINLEESQVAGQPKESFNKKLMIKEGPKKKKRKKLRLPLEFMPK